MSNGDALQYAGKMSVKELDELLKRRDLAQKVGGTWRHYKGPTYTVIASAFMHDTREVLVVNVQELWDSADL